jgi:hypothetical protein
MAEMVEVNYRQVMPLPPSKSQRIEEPMQVITITASDPSREITEFTNSQVYHEHNPQEAWLPITESRKGNTFFATFHLLCSGIGLQVLVLPLAFATLGW